MPYKLLKLTKAQLLSHIPSDISNVAQYIQSGGLFIEKTYKLHEAPNCGRIDCLKKNCPICASALTSWRKAVKERDHYTCKNCGIFGAVHAHHLLQRINFPEKAFDINNGVTLCEKCHRIAHAARRAN